MRLTASPNAQHDSPGHGLLLVAADLEERRLLLAELREEGHEVVPVPGLLPALQALTLGLAAPRLILVDTRDDEYATPEHIDELLQLSPEVPVVVLVSAIGSENWKPLESRLLAPLRRPIRCGEVADVVRRTMLARKPSCRDSMS